jgi:peptide/nickel transport system ATP-binding protein
MYNLIVPDALPEKRNSPPLLSVRNLSCGYSERTHGLLGKMNTKNVLDHVNLEMDQREIFGLSGESGCGKSTVARCIAGLIPYTGDVLINGENQNETAAAKQFYPRPWRLTLREQRLRRARFSQMVFQESGADLNPVKTIGWLMEEPLLIHRLYDREERAARVDEMLRCVGLDPSYKKRLPHELSGGQKQRICIGRSLMLSPKLLIADEAVNSLDVSTGAQILNLFLELNSKLGLGILFISHNTSAVEYLCGRIAVFEKRGEQ